MRRVIITHDSGFDEIETSNPIIKEKASQSINLSLDSITEQGLLNDAHVTILSNKNEVVTAGPIANIDIDSESNTVTLTITDNRLKSLPKSHQKGERNERQAVNIINRLYRAERVNGYGNTDPFHLADVIGIQNDLPVLFCQVKTNGITKDDYRYYSSWVRGKVDNVHLRFELWNRRDRKGWEMCYYDSEQGEFINYFSTSTCNPSTVRNNWFEKFKQSI